MYDIAVIGAGVIGSAVARELSRYQVKVCVVEKASDVCCGTSKANSAIVHAGFDAEPGTLKARLNVRGNEMMEQLAKELDFPFKRNGSLVVRTKEQPKEDLLALLEKGRKNGVEGLRILEEAEMRELEPNLSDGVADALYAPTGGIVCPFHLTMALAENAFENGVEFLFDTEVTEIQKNENGYTLLTNKEAIETRAVVNAAGVYSDVFHNMVSEDKIHIVARKGEYMLLDKSAGEYVSHTVFQLPGKMGKGVLVSPTVHGNLLVGPTATDVEDKEAVNTTQAGLDFLSEKASHSVKNVPLRQVITSFAGLRAHEEKGDFVLGEAADAPLFFDAAGIESPGLSAAPAIGEYLVQIIAEKLELEKKTDFKAERKGILNPAQLSIEERNELIMQKPAYGNIICRCEMISEGEILDAIHRPLGARTLDGIKRRTRAGMGRCQAGFCSPKTIEILHRELGLSMQEISKNGGSSQFIVGINKDIEQGGSSHEKL